MSHVISGRAYNRQALQSREMNGGASGSKAPSRKGSERPEDSKDHTEDSEPWISLPYQPAGSNIATKYHDKMISNEGVPIDFTMSNVCWGKNDATSRQRLWRPYTGRSWRPRHQD